MKPRTQAAIEAMLILTALTCALILMPISFYYPILKNFFS